MEANNLASQTSTTTGTTTAPTPGLYSSDNDAWKASSMIPAIQNSGRFRMAIGPAKARLFPNLVELRSKLNAAESAAKYDLSRIKSAKDMIHDYNQKWLSLIIVLDDKRRAEEDLIYDQFNQGPDGLNEILNEAEEAICYLIMRIDEIHCMLEDTKSTIASRASVCHDPPRTPSLPLPPMSVPEWNGDPLGYDPWWDVYNLAVHIHSIPDVQKWVWLDKSLTGKAKQAIAGLRRTNENYQIAIEILQKMSSPESIRRSLFQNLSNIPAVSEKAVEIRATVDKIEEILRQLEERGEDVNHPNIEYEIQKKLPAWMLRIIVEAKQSDLEWNVKKLREQLARILTIREEVERIQKPTTNTTSSSHSNRSGLSNRQQKPENKMHSSAFAVNNTGNPSQKSGKKNKGRLKYPCAFCGESHKNDQCKRFVGEARGCKASRDGLCFKCLGKMPDKHRLNECPYRRPCAKCQDMGHNTALHEYFMMPNRRSLGQLQHNHTLRPSNNQRAVAAAVHNEGECEPHIVASIIVNPVAERKIVSTLMLAKQLVLRVNGRRLATAFGFFDTGPLSTFIANRKARELNAKKIGEEWVSLDTFGGRTIDYMATRYEIDVQLSDGSYKRMEVLSSPTLVTNITVVRLPSDKIIVDTERKLHGYRLIDSLVGIMIGGPRAIQPVNAVVAKLEDDSEDDNDKDHSLSQQLEMLHSLDALGIKDPHDVDEDAKVMEHFKKTVSEDAEGRYRVALPWRSETPNLPNNYKICVARLKGEIKKLMEKNALEKYDEGINDLLKNDIIEEVDLNTPDGPLVSYIPHRAVFSPEKSTTKIRKVCDASQKGGPSKKSVNDNLHRGPDLLRNMMGILLRFRILMICVIADIQKAFHQVLLNPDDQDATRFVWLRDVHKPDNAAFPSEDAASETVLKYLGDTKKDTFIFEIPEKIRVEKDKITKRVVAKAVAGIFDPLGMMAPIILNAKKFLQHLWSKNYKWDEQLNEEDTKRWQRILATWSDATLTIPRRVIVNSKLENYQLHVFTDSSGFAFATTVYLRQKTENGSVTNLIFSKSRLLPIKRPTIPRAELLGVLAGVRALNFVLQELDLRIEKTYLWSDSKCVIAWILNLSVPQSVFVENRLQEIRAARIDEFRYVPSSENSSDIGTRGMTIEELSTSDLWWYGPKWLQLEPENWPAMPEQEQLKPEFWIDAKCEIDAVVASVVPLDSTGPVESSGTAETTTTSVIEFERFGSWERLVRAMAFVLRFAVKKAYRDKGDLTIDELWRAEKRLIQQAQREHPPKHKEIVSFDLQRDEDGIWRAYGRLGRSSLHTLAELRRNFWIPSGMATVKRAIYGCKNQRAFLGQCLGCRRALLKPFELPQMSELPAERVTRSVPFTFIGLDNFGPMYTKDSKDSKEPMKIWGLILTCMATRAVHLELVRDLTPHAFILALRRAFGRRTIPRMIVSDNSTTFKPSAKAVENLWDTMKQADETTEFFSKNRIQWKFIPEKAPFFGGFYERLIALIKNVLRRTFGRRCLIRDELATILVEIESIVNSRPLCYVPDDPTSRVLRPIDLINPGAQVGIPLLENKPTDPEFIPKLDSVEKIIHEFKKTSKITDEFYYVWEKDYLSALRERAIHQHDQPKSLARFTPLVNEIVLLKDENQPKIHWNLGRVMELVKSADGEVRVARVKTSIGHVLTRPINLLYPLEITNKALLSTVPEEPISEETSTRLKNQMVVTSAVSPLNALFYAFIVMILPRGMAVQCPEGEINQIVYRPHCTDHGIIVKRQSDQNLYWDYVRCDHGHMQQESSEFLNELELCKEKCQCNQTWADECSFYDGPSKALSNISLPKIAEALRELAPDVCSFAPAQVCDDTPKTARFGTILLYDGTMHFVKVMNTATRDAMIGEHICIGNDGPTTGTPQYCADHECAETGRTLCFHSQPHITMLEVGDVSIPLKAWGYKMVQYFDSIRVKRASDCRNCTGKCFKGSVEIHLDEDISIVAICNEIGDCSYHKNPGTVKKFFLQPEDMLSDHVIKIQVWSMGTLLKAFDVVCPAIDYCKDLCYFCFPRIGSPHCNWMLSLIIACYNRGVTAIVALGRCGLGGIARLLNLGCGGIIYLYRRWKGYNRAPNEAVPPETVNEEAEMEEIPLKTETTKGKTEEDTKPTTPMLKSPFLFTPLERNYMLTLLGIFVMLSCIESCAVSSAINASKDVCFTNSWGNVTCSVTYEEIVKLLPTGQQLCFLVKDPNGRPIATVKLEAIHAYLKCKTKTEAFLRSATFHSRSARRCPGAGSCTDTKCLKVGPNTTIPELGSEPNESPGLTFCEDGCSCWGCMSFYCDAACLFWRLYAVPYSSTFFEKFSCIFYEPLLTIRASIETHEVTSHDFTLAPGTSESWNKIKLTLNSLVTSSIPILDSMFVTDGVKTAIVTSASEHQLSKFVCKSIVQMANFQWEFTQDVCKCQTVQDTMHCVCGEQIIEKYLKDEDLLLPSLYNNSGIIHAKGRDFDGLSLAVEVENNVYHWHVYNLTGCYDCRRGATLTYICTTDFGEAHGHVECTNELRFSIICDKYGTPRNVTLFFNTPHVSYGCHIRCPARWKTYT
uniref:Integrase catalytic domain-containing protein n=1 Tax=Acrobeloides nanus TaxID=290746 RepID=A0A914ELN7_9BILA